MIRFLTHQTAGIKSDREIDRYIACHGRRHPWGPAATRPRRGQPRTPAADRDGDPVRDYMNDYRGLIRTAGQAFDVPPALLTCLIFRESQFEARNRSHTGARGLGQQIGQNVQFINDTITRRPGNHHFRPVVANRWRDYFQQVETSRRAGHVSRQAVCSGRFESRDDANCAAASIAAASVYIDHIRRDLLRASRTQSIEWENALDFYLVIAAAYNMGDSHGRAVARMGNVNTWLQAIKGRAPSERKHREVLGHVRAIRNCLAANNWEGLADRDPDFTEAQCTDRARARGL